MTDQAQTRLVLPVVPVPGVVFPGTVATLTLVFSSGCTEMLGDDDGGDDDDTVLPPPPAPAVASEYALTSTLDLSATTVLPETLYAAVDAMRGFQDHPGQTVLDLAELAGVPAVGTIRDALPNILSFIWLINCSPPSP